MLNNPKWDKTPTRIGLMLWLETQDPEGAYNFGRPDECLMKRYMSAIGAVDQSIETVWKFMMKHQYIAALKPWTFGAALERLRKQE